MALEDCDLVFSQEFLDCGIWDFMPASDKVDLLAKHVAETPPGVPEATSLEIQEAVIDEHFISPEGQQAARTAQVAGSNVIYVSQQASATDTRILGDGTPISKYDPLMPFASPAAAVSAAAAGDVVHVEPGTYVLSGPIATGKWFLADGVRFEKIGIDTGLFVTGAGQELIVEGRADLVTNASDIDHVVHASGGGIQKITCKSIISGLTESTFGQSAVSAFGAGTRQIIVADLIFGGDDVIDAEDGAEQYVYVKTISDHLESVSISVFANGAGTKQVVYADLIECVGEPAIVCSNSATQFVQVRKIDGTISPEEGGSILRVGGGNSTLDVLEEAASKDILSHPPIRIVSGTARLRGRFNTTATPNNPSITVAPGSTLILDGATIVAHSGAAESIHADSGTPSIKVYSAVANKAVDSDITQLVGTVLVDANVT